MIKDEIKMISVDLFEKAAIDIAADVLAAPGHKLATFEPLRRHKKELARLWQEEELLSTTEKRLYESPAL
jgi:hypothetical protein